MPILHGLLTTLAQTELANKSLTTYLEILAQRTLIANSTLTTLSVVFLESVLLKLSDKLALNPPLTATYVVPDFTVTKTRLAELLSLWELPVTATTLTSLATFVE